MTLDSYKSTPTEEMKPVKRQAMQLAFGHRPILTKPAMDNLIHKEMMHDIKWISPVYQ